MITTFSGAADRSEISEAGKFSELQYQRPSSAWRTWPPSPRKAEQPVGGLRTERVAGLERQLEHGGPQVGEQDVEVVGVEARLLGLAAEQELGVVDHVLVDRRRRRDEDRDAHVAPATGASHLLPGGGDRARVAGQHRDVEAADVDAQLEGVGADDAQDLAVAQPALDRSPLRGQVAAAVAAQPRPRAEVHPQGLAQVREHDLDGDPRPPEHDRLAAGPQERQGPALGQGQRRAARPGRAVEDRRVDQQQVLLARRGAVAIDRPDRAGRRAARRARTGCRSSRSSTRSRGCCRSGRTAAAAGGGRSRRGCRTRRGTCAARR